ncbi:MAG: HAMP domain-containing histidine kinase [Alphaproteobacteria bacterium]|nr:HAMP domain-containing histidine kinase [Alphaproteobacteria bacterium]
MRRRLRWAWSLTGKTILLAIIFLLVPAFLYIQFRNAYEEGQDLLLRSVRAQGRVISRSLLSDLQNADSDTLPKLGASLSRFAGEVTTIKLLLAPTGAASDDFYYVASWPTVAPANLQAERNTLAQQGVLDRLARNCRGEMEYSLIYHRPTGGAEIVTAVTPLATPVGCWAIVASFSEDAFPSAHLGQPYWATPAIRLAAVIYLAMAAITFSTLLGVRRGLRRFARRARYIRTQGPDAGSFGARADVPELGEVAAEFDRMIEAIHRSAAEIRRAAEDNAHAFKTPIAVIRQSLEPLRRSAPLDNPRAQRAIGLVEHALDRLDGLVASARELDEATADLIDEPLARVDLGRVLGRLVQQRSAIHDDRDVTILLTSRDLTITRDLLPGLHVLGSEAMIETVFDNLIDNAMSFSPAGSEVVVHVSPDGQFAHLIVSDRGPGVPEDHLERIFDRYYSERRDAAAGASGSYFGIGLWIARRNVEAMGGTVIAENRSPHGLRVHVRLPLAPGRG